MSLFFRDRRKAPARPEQRGAGWQEWLTARYGVGGYTSVDLASAESSLQSVAVWAAIDLIVSLGSELPVHVYSGEGADRRKRPTPGYLEDPSGEGTGLEDWSAQVLMSWLLRGNLYGDILDTRSGHPTQVLLHHPDDVTGWIDSDNDVRWSVMGKPVTDMSRFLHRRVNPVPGRVLGLSPVEWHASQIGLSLTATRFGLQWFQDGAHPSGMLVNSEVPLDKKQIQSTKDIFMAAVFGSREPLVLGKGWEYKAIQLKPEESQFLQTQGYTEAQCARIFGPGIAEIMGYESGGNLTYANVESRMTHLLTLSVNKWLRRLERLLTEMLPRPQYARVDRDAVLQSTTLDRYRAHSLALRDKWKTPNEVRSDEDMGPVAWGDKPISTSAPADGEDPDDDPSEGGTS